MNKKHILILGDVDSVKEYMDFFENQYSIITSAYEFGLMPSSIKYAANAIYKIETPSYFDATCFERNIEEILKCVDKIIEHFGGIDCVVSTHEHTVLPAAIIRTHYNIHGLKEDQARFLRDKNDMKLKISSKGILTPQFIYLEKNSYVNVINNFIEQYHKVVLKPIDQAGSNDILVTENLEIAIKHVERLFKESKKVLLEQYIDLPVMNFDGVAYNGEIQFLSVSQKVGNCYNYVQNRESIATILLNKKEVYTKAKHYVEKCLSSLDIKSLVFHLEVFTSDMDNYVFLEIAGRYPGSGITNLIEKVFKIDLVKISYDLDCQIPINPLQDDRIFNDIKPTAMLLLPSPVKKTILIRGVSGIKQLPKNIIGSEIQSPGNLVRYSSIDAFQSLARIYISDENLLDIENTINEIKSKIKFEYEEV